MKLIQVIMIKNIVTTKYLNIEIKRLQMNYYLMTQILKKKKI